MLKLHRLEISGFKSFVDPVSLDFSGGITAIVGPNGCGKSNVCDAITWALGEQSAKSMRGDTMEDVIFNGSESRRPLGIAEVTLSLAGSETDDSIDAIENGQLVLSRRVLRTGESQYRLNGKLVRLKDFRDLLMGTGLGLRAYSVIEQGKIGMILSGKPQERRKLIEEAAGLTRYRARKKVAELKLEEATANLLRLNDIVDEIERNLRSLRRQAGAARRYQEKHGEMRRLLEATLVGGFAAIDAELTQVRGRIGSAQDADAGLAASLHRHDADLVASRESLDAFNDALAARHKVHAETVARIEGRQQFLKGARQTVEEIQSQLASGESAARGRDEQLAAARTALAEVSAHRAGVAAQRQSLAALVAQDDRAIAAAHAEVQQTETALETLRGQLLASLDETNRLRNGLHREQIESEKGSYQKGRLSEQLGLWSSEIDQASSALAGAREKVRALLAELDTQQESLLAAQNEATATRTSLATAREAENRLDRELAGTRQRWQVLEELAAAQSDRQALWRRELDTAGLSSPRFLGERLRPLAGWERSLDLFLGEMEDAVLLDDEASTLALASQLSASGVAGRFLVPVTELASDEGTRDLADAAIVSDLGRALGLPEALARALPPAYLVLSREDAVRLARRHPGVAFLSPDRLWAQGGLLHVQGEQAQPGRLARQSEAAVLAARLPSIEGQLAETRDAVAGLDEVLATAEAALAEKRADNGRLRERLAADKAHLDSLEKRHQRLAVEADTLRTESAEVERELVRVAERERTLAGDLERAAARHADLERSFDARQGEVDARRARREALGAEGASRRGQLNLLDERLANHDREMSRLERLVSEGARQDTAWSEQAGRLAQRRQSLLGDIANAATELQEALLRQASLETALTSEQETLDSRRLALRDLEQGSRRFAEQREGLRGTLEELRIRAATRRQEAEHLAASYREEFHAEMPVAGVEIPPNLAELQAGLLRARDAIERLGPVNVLAAGEFGEQEERHAFLTAQRADVAQSVDSLKRTIREINETSSARFLETFKEVNQNFGRTFSQLFRGGEAEMRLLDEEDLLESGIEIVARPPGKRLQNLMLLSGGEKALTAIALLFALFRSKPSPFCILDEVDAPLDEINTLRFVEVLRQMSKDTQFIMVTHNKLSMEVAATLYGVTMEERGVSKLVAVQLEDVHPEEAVATA
jgi:chromosome segregation protein